MRSHRAVLKIDYALLGLMAFFVLMFHKISLDKDLMTIMAVILSTCFLLWQGLRGRLVVSIYARIAIAAAVFGGVKYFTNISGLRLVEVLFFLVIFSLFSTRRTRQGASLRLACGLIAGIMLISKLPMTFGIPIGVCILFVIIGGLISLWSNMTLETSLGWFVSRSIRKETIFLILFLAGIFSIGLRQSGKYGHRGSSGLSKSISSGSLDSLALSSEMAMQVTFQSRPPVDPYDTYFRAAVLDNFVEFTWTAGANSASRVSSSAHHDFEYTVELSPRYPEFAPVLDYGVSIAAVDKDLNSPLPSLGQDDGVFLFSNGTDSWKYYRATSLAEPMQKVEENVERFTRAPHKVDPRLSILAQELRPKMDGDAQEFIERLKTYYVKNNFQYSLAAPKDMTQVADFMFIVKSGFCQHFAAASAMMARLVGIPSRVVTGFLGGAWDEDSKTLVVRDLDAHAWTEFWDAKSGRWLRFDAVAFVAPDRLANGAEEFLRSVGAAIPDALAMRQQLFLSRFLMSFDKFSSSVSTDVSIKAAESLVEYGEAIAMVGVLGLTSSFVMLRLRERRVVEKRPEQKFVLQLEGTLNQHNAARQPGEPLRLWLARCASRSELLALELAIFADAYENYCYGRHADKKHLLAMHKQAVKVCTGTSRKSYFT
jgi:transglutaminase-like putative cysteine protease